MHSTLNPKPTDPHADPHDDVLVARIEEEFSSLAPDAVRLPPDPQTQIAPDFSGGPAIPPVDTTFRATAVNNAGQRPSIGRRATRAVAAFLVAGCIGIAAIVSQSYGNVAKQMVGRWLPKFVMTASQPLENTGLAEPSSPPAVQANAAPAAPPQPAAPARTAPESVAPAASADSAQLLQAMARDLASARQEIDQLKASQQQMSRDIARVSEARSSDIKSSDIKSSEAKPSDIRSSQAKASEPSQRPRISALPPKPAAAPVRRPTPSYPPPQAAAVPQPLPPPAAAAPYAPRQPDYVPRQPEPPPQATAYPPQADPELSSVPRPPMPLRTGSFSTLLGQ